MVMLETNEDEVRSILQNLNTDSATRCDGISTKLLKMINHTIVPIVTKLTNLCIESGTFPNALKMSIINPIFKAGDRNSITNYRPIPILPALSMIVEKIMNRRLLAYLEKENILSNNQFGFRAGKSTSNAVGELAEFVGTNIDKKNKCIGVFLDLAKAFDTVSVPILLSKMDNIGIRGTSLDLFKDYLTNRKQQVKIGNKCSKGCSCCQYGVPQGSVLGPTLFLLYINDLCDLNIKHGKLYTFADDTALIFHGKTWEKAQKNAESGLRRAAEWFTENLLTLNATKTKYILFSNTKRTLPLDNTFKIQLHSCLDSDQSNCGCPTLERTKTIKYLGVLLDEHLTWVPHINLVAGRTRKLIFIFKKLRHVADYPLLKTIYYALAQSILSYCITTWGGARKTHLKTLEKAQRSLLKVIKFKHYRYSTVALYSECDVLSIRQLFVLETIKSQHKRLPYDKDFLKKKRRAHRVCPSLQFKTSFIAKFQCNIGPLLYNKINNILNIYPLNHYECKKILTSWLKSKTYEEIEDLLEVTK